MVLIVKVLSIVIIVQGCFFLLRPEAIKKVFEWVKAENRIYFVTGSKWVVGLLLLFAASQCSVPWIIYLFGALSLFAGIAVFILKKESLVKFIEWYEVKLTKKKFLAGGIVLILGILLALAV